MVVCVSIIEEMAEELNNIKLMFIFIKKMYNFHIQAIYQSLSLNFQLIIIQFWLDENHSQISWLP